jgi:branched-chain amino acid transport system substrate-binding protein
VRLFCALWKVRALVGVVGVALVISACSSGGSGNGGSSGSVKTITIGGPNPLTGTYAENGQDDIAGMQVAADEINAAGGIKSLGGAQIRIVSGDTSSDDPAQAQTVTQKLIESSHVTALVGSYLSSLSLTSSTAAERAGIPYLTTSTVDTLTSRGYRNVFEISPKASTVGPTALQELVDLESSGPSPVKSIAVVSGNDASSIAAESSISSQAKKMNIGVSGEITYPPGLSDASPIVSKIVSAKPDAILYSGSLPDSVLLVKGIRAAGIAVPMLSFTGGPSLTPAFAKALGSLANGILVYTPWADDVKLPGVTQARADYLKKTGQSTMPSDAGVTWLAVQIIAAALEKSASSSPSKLRGVLAGTEFTSGPASAYPPGKVAFDSTGASKYAQLLFAQWQNGKVVTVAPAAYAAAKPEFGS